MESVSSANLSNEDNNRKKSKVLARHNRSQSEQHNYKTGGRDRNVRDSRKSAGEPSSQSLSRLKAVHTVTGALNSLFKWTSTTPIVKQLKAFSVDSLHPSSESTESTIREDMMTAEQRQSSSSLTSERRKSSNLVPKIPSIGGSESQREGSPDISSSRHSQDGDKLSRKNSANNVSFTIGESSQKLTSSEGTLNDNVSVSRRSTDSSDGHRSATETAATDLREKCFEKSLNDILDKCSERSLDLPVDGRELKVTDDAPVGTKVPKSVEKKKKSSAWYTMITPSYKSRSEDFKKQFKDIPADERLIVDYSCALQREILVHGRMFVTQNWICFYANIFRWETIVTIPMKEVSAITKEKTARVIPNAIQVSTDKDKYFFTSFTARDKTFMMLFRLWQNVLMEQPMSPRELWQWVHCSYGEELGLTSSDDDYVSQPSIEEDLKEDLQIKDDQIKDDSSDLIVTSDLQSNLDDGDSLLADRSCVDLKKIDINSAHNKDDPTDFSDTTEDSEGEVVCSEHDHLPKLAHNEVYYLTVDKLFELIFTDCPFFRHFCDARKLQDVNVEAWKDDPDEKIGRVRMMTYTVPLNAPFGPKTSQTNEKQICYTQSQPGVLYVIDGECNPTGIPYADAFYVVNRYCITRVSKDKVRLRVTSEVRFKKSVWGVMKNLIERNSVQGVLDYFDCLGTHLRRESDKNHTLQSHRQPSKKKLRKRRSHGVRSAIPSIEMTASTRSIRQSRPTEKMAAPPTPVRSMISAQKEEKLLKLNADTLVRIVCFILILLVMFNALLFYKLWSLENLANVLYFPHSHETMENFLKHPPKSQEEWVHLLKQQQYFHEAETDKWKEILSTSITLIERMKGTLVELKHHVDSRPASLFDQPHMPDPP